MPQTQSTKRIAILLFIILFIIIRKRKSSSHSFTLLDKIRMANHNSFG